MGRKGRRKLERVKITSCMLVSNGLVVRQRKRGGRKLMVTLELTKKRKRDFVSGCIITRGRLLVDSDEGEAM